MRQMGKIFSLLMILLLISGCREVKESEKKGKEAFDFTLPNLAGENVRLSSFRGKVVLLDFWATWCPPCRVSIPYIQSLYEKHQRDGLEVLGVSLDKGGEEVLRPFVEKNGITYTILVGNREIGQSYEIKAIPTLFLLDKKGSIRFHQVGFNPEVEKKIEEKVKQLLSE